MSDELQLTNEEIRQQLMILSLRANWQLASMLANIAKMLAHAESVAAGTQPRSEERDDLVIIRSIAIGMLMVLAQIEREELQSIGLRVETGDDSVVAGSATITAAGAISSRNKRLRIAGALTLDRKIREQEKVGND